MAKAKKAPPDPSANEDMMPKGMGEIARQMLEQGKKEKQPTKISDDEDVGYKRGGKIGKALKAGKIGKYQRYGKNTKKFAGGGSADDGELSLDNLSLAEARNVARNMVEMGGDPSLKHFTWRGQKYAIAAPRPRPQPAAPAPTSDAPLRPKADPNKPVYGANWSAMQSPDTGEVESVAPESYLMGPGMGKALAGLAGATAIGAGARALAPRLANRYVQGQLAKEGARQEAEIMARSAARQAQRQAAGRASAASRAGQATGRTTDPALIERMGGNFDMNAKLRALADKEAAAAGDWTDTYGLGMKRGGKIKKRMKRGGRC